MRYFTFECKKKCRIWLKKQEASKEEIEEKGKSFLKINANRSPCKTECRDKLSGGQQQRVALLKHCIKPDVLLMDEPLSNLDAKLRGGDEQQLNVFNKWE